jgi:CRISPR-associated protein Cmr4
MPETESGVFVQVRHWIWAIDPIHVGMGRQQISRIDMPVTREQGTQLPVIPGSSLTGVCRAYSAMKHAKGGLACAGKGNQDGEGHCGKSDCPVCHAFGFSREKSTQSRQGLVQITTAHLLFFPIASQHGPVWITCNRSLKEAGWVPPEGFNTIVEPGHFVAINGTTGPRLGQVNTLALGWLNLQRQVCTVNVTAWNMFGSMADGGAKSDASMPFMNMLGPVVLVDDAHFGTLVNDNMEVRTLVSIKPDTGAADAESGALFTYEAIPRGALLWFDVIFTRPKVYGLTEMTLPMLHKAVESGFSLMEYLGVGGMNTRGLGRIQVLSAPCVIEGEV